MRLILTSSLFAVLVMSGSVNAQVGMPGIEYSTSIAAGDGGQLYPYDQQDPWLHGQFQRIPAYGGYSSFRPYNYRHVFSQTQLAAGWGSAHGMPYSHQFWNKYRGSYLQGNLHSAMSTQQPPVVPDANRYQPIYQTGFGSFRETGSTSPQLQTATGSESDRSIHIFPSSVTSKAR
jgi:hypothetical protein